MSDFREQLLNAARTHALWPASEPPLETPPRYKTHLIAVCSCGFEVRGSQWQDDLVLNDLSLRDHPDTFVIAYPPETPEASMGGVFIGFMPFGPLEQADLMWLLAQPGLPDEFRRAAALHLERTD